jgi:CHAT domain
VKKILILSANPQNTEQLRLEEEVREIQAGLERSKMRDRFEIITRSAVRVEDLRRTLLDCEPHIVHFSGHGVGEGGLVLETDRAKSRGVQRKFTAIGEGELAFEDDNGQMQLVSTAALADLFRLFQNTIECVVLNACYSEVQAKAIHQHINCVIGMDRAIGDRAAIEFAIGFYDAVGAGETYDRAYAFGCNAIALMGIPEFSTPVLLYRQGIASVDDRQPISAESTQLDRQVKSTDSAVAIDMTATGENAKQIGQIGQIDNFTM